MQNLKSQIKERLFNALRQKFSAYQPESAYMPFHTRLLVKIEWHYIVLSKVLIQILARVFLSLWQRNLQE